MAGASMTAPAGEKRLGVLGLSNQFPSPWEPHLAPFNGRQLRALSALCDLRLVSPVPFFRALGKPPGVCAPEPFPVVHPWFWYAPGVLRSWQGRFYLASCWPALKRAASELRPQVLYATWLHPDCWAGMMAAQRLGLPLAVKVHGSDLNLFAQDPQRRPYLQRVLTRARAVVAPSRALIRAAVALGADERRAMVVPNGVDHQLFFPADKLQARGELGFAPEVPRLLFVGELHKIKGPELALQALARLPGVAMAVVGKGEMRAELERLAGELGLGERVAFTGSLPAAEVAKHMAAADALVLASRNEGEPNVVLEALACGRPVAATTVGGVPDLVLEGEQGALAAPGEVESLAQAMTRVLARRWDPEPLAASVAGRSWEASATRLLEALALAAGGEA